MYLHRGGKLETIQEVRFPKLPGRWKNAEGKNEGKTKNHGRKREGKLLMQMLTDTQKVKGRRAGPYPPSPGEAVTPSPRGTEETLQSA